MKSRVRLPGDVISRLRLHHPHPWQAQPAATIGPYAPCNQIHTAATTWPGKHYAAKAQAPGPACTIPSLRGRTRASPLGAQRKAGQHSGYNNCSIHTLHTAEILQQANGCHKEEARASNYAWHGTPSKSVAEVIQPQPPALPPEAWPCECNTNKAKQPKRDKVFLNTTHC